MLQIDLTNKVAVVTGGSGELGRVMARTLAGCGPSM
jgi:3-oxoacyl-[acyl-carrier protein] reductase